MKKSIIKLLSLGFFALLGLSAIGLTPAMSLADGVNEITDITGNLQELTRSQTLEKHYETQDEPFESALLLTALYLPNPESAIKVSELYNAEYKTVYLLIGIKNDDTIYSRFVLLACSLAVLGAAIIYIRTRSKYLLK